MHACMQGAVAIMQVTPLAFSSFHGIVLKCNNVRCNTCCVTWSGHCQTALTLICQVAMPHLIVQLRLESKVSTEWGCDVKCSVAQKHRDGPRGNGTATALTLMRTAEP